MPTPRPELARFASWLVGRMRERRLGRNQLAQYLEISQSSVSEYARALRRPRLEMQRKLAAYFGVPLEEVEALLPDAGGAAQTPTGAILHTPDAVRGILPGDEAAPSAPGTQALLAEVALPLLLGDVTPEEMAYLADFARRVRARRAASAGGQDDAGRGGPAGGGDAG